LKNPYLIGLHCYLRPLERDDAPTLTPFLNDAEVTRTLAFHRPVNTAGEAEFIDGLAKDAGQVVLGICDAADDALIGVAGIHRIDPVNRHGFFGLFIGERSRWGRGLGTEVTRLMTGLAFETLNLNRVYLHAIAPNERGLRAYRRVGYRREGVLREDFYREGRFHDTVVMGILRSEWEARRARRR
jgi:diamine N-acetyltransferase